MFTKTYVVLPFLLERWKAVEVADCLYVHTMLERLNSQVLQMILVHPKVWDVGVGGAVAKIHLLMQEMQEMWFQSLGHEDPME